MANKLIVSAAPHITSADSTSKIMGRVCIALLPTLIASVLIFGFQALLLTAVTVAACVVFEYAYCKLVGRDVTISDLSAVVTGLLLAFNLPAGLPVWMSLVGAFIAIVIIKQLFGGLGYNFANPAIVGRIAMALGFAGAHDQLYISRERHRRPGLRHPSGGGARPPRTRAPMSPCCWATTAACWVRPAPSPC